MHIRQGLAFLFFAALLLATFDRRLAPPARAALVAVFGCGLVVSHYSSAYIAIALLLFAVGISFLRRRGTAGRERWLSPVAVGVIVLFAVIWLGPVTGEGTDLGSFAQRSFDALPDAFSGDVRAANASPLEQLNPFHSVSQTKLLQDFATAARDRASVPATDRYSPSTYRGYKLTSSKPPDLESRVPDGAVTAIYGGAGVLALILRLAVLAGVALVFAIPALRRRLPQDFRLLAAGSLVVLAAVLLLPFASLDYSADRTYQQLLLVLALPAVLALSAAVRRLGRVLGPALVAGLVVTHFAVTSGLVAQAVGGRPALNLQLNNRGPTYEQIYTRDGDVAAARWLRANRVEGVPVHADNYGYQKLQAFGPIYIGDPDDLLVPSLLERDSYVFLTAENVRTGRGWVYAGGRPIGYHLPLQFLEQHKRLVFESEGARVYR